ncbi:ABC transporter permease [Falsirhodobacter deserti]|uniref:ABC transporter permease n=1 Tax=Falsirhodobacter deserti TaxID=1365611 RepID=UPI000FE2B2A3|nr:ABC transporter permease [Falsirhodobacter deserti]
MIHPVDMALAAVMVLVCGGLSVWLSLRLHGALAVAALRMIVQLVLVGLILRFLMGEEAGWLTLPVMLVMLAAATREVGARQSRRLRGIWHIGIAFLSIGASALPVALAGLFVVTRGLDLTDARHVVPLLGIILGSTMNTASIALNHLCGAVYRDRLVIETRLALGQTRRQALADLQRQAVHAGMIPVLNQMAGAGLITLPGIMSGQVLAGMDPLHAAGYQILLMLLLATAGVAGAVLAVRLTLGRLMDARDRLQIDRLH